MKNSSVADVVRSSFDTVQSWAEEIRNNELQVISPAVVEGDMWSQGDVLFVRLNAVPAEWELDNAPLTQLAPGTTQGSRHCLESLSGLTCYKPTTKNELDGPVIEATKAFVVTHPEHGHVKLPAGVWGIVYQRAHAEDLRRTRD